MDNLALNLEELTDAADEFFTAVDFVMTRLPEGTSVKDILHVMDVVADIGYRNRDRKSKIVGFVHCEDPVE